MDLGKRTDCRLEKQVWDLLGKEFLGPVCLGYVLGRCECGVHVHLALQTFYPVGRGGDQIRIRGEPS